jgi:hypothetical protein
MVRKDIDMMPRQFAVALMTGMVCGSACWAGLIALVIR